MNPDQENLTLDILQESDLPEVTETFCFPWTTREAVEAKWNRYLSENKQGTRRVILVKLQAKTVGYGSLLKVSEYPPFKEGGIPEIHDVWVMETYRGRGVGKKLIQRLEELAQSERYKRIGLGVGIYQDYGRAQKLYACLGYIPNGLGATYKYLSVVPGKTYPVDDDLLIWLTKELT